MRPLLSDPVRPVRIETASTVAGDPIAELPADLRTALDDATIEYIAAQEFNVDRPEAHLNLALLFARQEKPASVEAELKAALSMEPVFAPAAINLADAYRALGRDADGEVVLRSTLARTPDEPALLHALGLLLVRKR